MHKNKLDGMGCIKSRPSRHNPFPENKDCLGCNIIVLFVDKIKKQRGDRQPNPSTPTKKWTCHECLRVYHYK